MGIKRIEFYKSALFFLLICFFLSPSLTEARRVKGSEAQVYPLNQAVINSDGRVFVNARTFRVSPVFSGHRLVKITETSYAIVSPDEVMEFIVDLQFLDLESLDSEVIDVDELALLRPLPLGTDRLKFATNLLESNTVKDVQEALLSTSYGSIFSKVSESDWERLKNITNKFGLQRLKSYFESAVGMGIKDPVYYLLEVVPNPRHALERIENIRHSAGAAAEFDTTQEVLDSINDETNLMKEEIPQFIFHFIQETRGSFVEGLGSSDAEALLGALALDVSQGLTLVVHKIEKVLAHYRETDTQPYLRIADLHPIVQVIRRVIGVLKDFARGHINPNYGVLTTGAVPQRNGEIFITEEGNLVLWDNDEKRFRPLSEFRDGLPAVRVCYADLDGSPKGLRISSRFNWRGSYTSSNFDIRFFIEGDKQQFRFDKENRGKNTAFKLDLNSPQLTILWERWSLIPYSPSIPSVSYDWEGHHYRLWNLQGRIIQISVSEGRESEEAIRLHLEKIFRLIFPLFDGRHSNAAVTIEFLEAYC